MLTPRLEALPPGQSPWLDIDLSTQRLALCHGDKLVRSFFISSGLAGTGQRSGSGRTPLGWHYVRARIGAGQPLGAVYRGRRPTGEIYSSALAAQYPTRDWILTRIIWLCGLEPGFNRGGDVDSQRRYIYLHGTPPEEPMGVPASHGCIRLRDDALLEAFDWAPPGTPVWLHE